MKPTTLTMHLSDFSQALQAEHGLTEPSYTVQVIHCGKELAGFGLVGTGRVIMQTPCNDTDLKAAFMSAQLREKPKARTTRENIALPSNDYGKSVTFNRFG